MRATGHMDWVNAVYSMGDFVFSASVDRTIRRSFQFSLISRQFPLFAANFHPFPGKFLSFSAFFFVLERATGHMDWVNAVYSMSDFVFFASVDRTTRRLFYFERIRDFILNF